MAYVKKYIKGPQITSVDQLAALMRDDAYIIEDRGNTHRPVHAGWYGSWQFRMTLNLIAKGCLFEALINPLWTPEKGSTTDGK